MLNVDLSKTIPKGSHVYVAAFVPGLFFELSLLLGNPELVDRFLRRLRPPMSLNIYLDFGIGLFFGFVIGNAFLLLVTPVLQSPVNGLYRLLMHQRERREWTKKSGGHFPIGEIPVSREVKDAEHCWTMLAQKLLQARYGIDIAAVGRGREVLYWSVGPPTAEDRRGSLILIATYATGLCGLVAALLAPELRNRYYLVFCLFLIAVGLFHSYQVAERRNNPLLIAYARIRALLSEYEEMRIGVDEQSKSSSASQGGEAQS